MMMVMAGAVFASGILVMELAVPVMIMMVGIMLRGVEGNVGKQHMVMVMLSDDAVLDRTNRAGDGGLGENEQQGNAEHRPEPTQKGPDRFHHRKPILAPAGRQSPGRPRPCRNLGTPASSTPPTKG